MKSVYKEKPRQILHIDMDAFFAAVEQKRKPSIIGKPVVIGGTGNPLHRGVVSTASYEARRYGIYSGIALKTAYKLCPHAVFLPVDYREYLRISKIIKSILRNYTSFMEDVGIDEAFLDISHLDIAPKNIEKTIKERIKNKTGLTCSIGIAPNKLLAKIASDMKKPDGLTIISDNDIERVLWPLPVRKLWGIGPKTENTLHAMSIHTVGDLAAQPLATMVATFGHAHGKFLYRASRGIDETPLITHWEPKSFSRETTFQKDVASWQTVAKTLADLTRMAVRKMNQKNFTCRTVTLKIRFNDFSTQTKAKTITHHTESENTIRQTAFECLRRIAFQKKIRLVGIRISNLSKKTG